MKHRCTVCPKLRLDAVHRAAAGNAPFVLFAMQRHTVPIDHEA